MSRIVAVEWDDREARLAVASSRAGRIVLEQALELPFGEAGQPATAGAAIAAALDGRRFGRATVLAAVGRASIELKQLALPPAPDDDLPDLVRFQALREFNTLSDNWPLDFLPLSGSESEPRTVLAAAIAPELVTQIQETCGAAHLPPKRIVLRACAAANLLLRHRALEGSRVRLLVDILGDEADLTVLSGAQVVFLRTARLPGHTLATSEDCRPLISEIRRTIAAIQNQLGGERVAAVDLCGTTAEHATLAQRLVTDLGLPVELFDPFGDVELSRELKQSPPAHPGRFAPLIGMLLDEADSGLMGKGRGRHSIDFLNPRERPPAPNQRRTALFVGAGVAAVLLLLVGWVWMELGNLDKQIADKLKHSKSADKAVAQAKKLEQSTKQIAEWTDAEVAWLDELRELAREFPESKDAMLTLLRLAPRPGGGEIRLEGLVKSAGTIDALEAALRDGEHKVGGAGRRQDNRQQPYEWRFESTVLVNAAAKDRYQEPASEPDPTKSKATAAAESKAEESKAAAPAVKDEGGPADSPAAKSAPAESQAKSDGPKATASSEVPPAETTKSDATKSDAAKSDAAKSGAAKTDAADRSAARDPATDVEQPATTASSSEPKVKSATAPSTEKSR